MEKFFYRVQAGESVLSLAQKFNLSANRIIADNNLKKEISQGDLLLICKNLNGAYKIKPFETAESLAQKAGVSPQKILSKNGVDYLFYGLMVVLEE